MSSSLSNSNKWFWHVSHCNSPQSSLKPQGRYIHNHDANYPRNAYQNWNKTSYVTQNRTKHIEEMMNLMEMRAHIPAAWQKHGLLNKDWTRQEDVPTGPNVIRTAQHTHKYYNITHTHRISQIPLYWCSGWSGELTEHAQLGKEKSF